MSFVLYADDGKGNVAEAISVKSGQKFWFKGMANPNSTIEIWFNEYEPYPPHNYVKSWWLCTVTSNEIGYYDSSPYDTCKIVKTGKKDDKGNLIYRLEQSKLGTIWEGVILNALEFQATSGDDKSNVAVVAIIPTTFWEDYFVPLALGGGAIGLVGGMLLKKSVKKKKVEVK